MYFGTQAVISEKKLDNGQLEVTLEPLKADRDDGLEVEKRVVNEKAFRPLLTEDVGDADLTELRKNLYAPAIAEIIDVLIRHNIRVIDTGYFTSKIGEIVQSMEVVAIEKALGCSQYNRSLKDLQID